MPLAASAAGNRRLYTGREYLPDLGVYDYRQRLYDPTLGRFLTTDPVHDPVNLGNPYTYVGNNPGAFVDPYGEERWGTQSYWRESLDVGYGYFIRGPIEIVTGLASAAMHPIETSLGLLSLGKSLVAHPLETSGDLLEDFYAQFDDTDTAGSATFGVVSVITPGAGGATKGVRAAQGGRTTVRAATVTNSTRAAATVEQSAIRLRVLKNIQRSTAARQASRFPVHVASEAIHANANRAVKIAKEAGLTNKSGALGLRAHQEFARLNAATNKRLTKYGAWIDIEPYVDPLGGVALRGARNSVSVDALLYYKGNRIRSFDLKTGRLWSTSGVLERQHRFDVPVQQIQR